MATSAVPSVLAIRPMTSDRLRLEEVETIVAQWVGEIQAAYGGDASSGLAFCHALRVTATGIVPPGGGPATPETELWSVVVSLLVNSSNEDAVRFRESIARGLREHGRFEFQLSDGRHGFATYGDSEVEPFEPASTPQIATNPGALARGRWLRSTIYVDVYALPHERA